MINRVVAAAAIALPLCVSSVSSGHAQGSGDDAVSALTNLLQSLGGAGGGSSGGGGGGDSSTYVVEEGTRRPIVYENGDWGYHDRYGRWVRAPEANRRYLEYYHPHGQGFRPGERFYRNEADLHRGGEPGRGPDMHHPGQPGGMPGVQHPSNVIAAGQHPGINPGAAHPGGVPAAGHPGIVPTAHPAPQVAHAAAPAPVPPKKH
jgi:hypothetical protein